MRNKLRISLTAAAILLIILGSLIVSNLPLTIPLSEKAAAKYDRYHLAIPNGESIDTFIRRHVVYKETVTAGEITLDIYTSNTLGTLLFDCALLTEISHSNYGTWNISYSTKDHKEVYLTYHANGTGQLVIYDQETDRCVEITPQYASLYTNFRNTRPLFS